MDVGENILKISTPLAQRYILGPHPHLMFGKSWCSANPGSTTSSLIAQLISDINIELLKTTIKIQLK